MSYYHEARGRLLGREPSCFNFRLALFMYVAAVKALKTVATENKKQKERRAFEEESKVRKAWLRMA